MDGSVLFEAVAHLWKGVYCSRQYQSYGMECTVPGISTVMEGSVLF